MRSDPPIVDDLYTRQLERGAVVRASVQRATVVAATPTGFELATTATARHRLGTSAAGSPLADGASLPGRLRIDVVADDVLRVRYAEGDRVPDNCTPMVVGAPRPPRDVRVATGEETVRLVTASLAVDVGLDPLALDVRTPGGRHVCTVGGPEKNHLALTGFVWDAFNTGICRALPDGRPLAVECFALHPQEAIYGFGEQFIRLDKVGQTIDLVMVEALGVTTPRSYKNVPFYLSTRGYGVFFNHSARMTCWVGSRAAADVQIAIEDDFLDYYLFVGDLQTILVRYTDLTGKGRMPPRWSFGYWQSKISYASAAEALEVVRGMRAAEVPMDVLHLDTHWFAEDWRCDLEFARDRFPDPAAFLAEMAARGVRACVWQLPYVPEGSQLYDDLASAGAFVRDRDGEIYDVGICYAPSVTGRVGCIDWTNPAAHRVYGEHLARLFRLGVRCIKADFGEQAPLDGVYHDGTPGHRAHNLYPLLYNQAIADMTRAATGEDLIWARSAWAGSQRYPLHWGGDSSPNWHNLVPQIEGGLSLGLSGFQFWSQDIGGFFGQTDGRLLVRWLQAGLFLSHARIHGIGDRELYKFEGDVLRIGRAYVQLRYRLLPYLWATARDCVARSLPMARPLVLEWQDDPNTWRIGDQWLLGDALLVAPITDASDRRAVYLPRGRWTDWWTGAVSEGGRWYDVVASLDTLPLWLREGAVVPLGPVMQWVGERPTDVITLRIAPFANDGETRLDVLVDDDIVPLHYVASRGMHRVTVGPTRVRFVVETVDRDAPAVALVSGGRS
jgi:alpha-D-xyloside xylohydrolase